MRLGRIVAAPVMLGLLLVLGGPSSAEARPSCLVPKTVGDTLVVAERHVRAGHCSVGAITRPKTSRTVKLYVAQTSPTAGKRLAANTPVAIKMEKATRLALSGKMRYGAKVDPSFTQDPDNPLAVTYAYSADAISQAGALTLNMATSGDLPDGVLDLYSSTTPGGPESLFCSINVGGSVSSGKCLVKYSQPGTYAVTTEYIPSGTAAVTETDQETIDPLPTVTVVEVSQGPCSPSDSIQCYILTPVVTGLNGNSIPSVPVLLQVTCPPPVTDGGGPISSGTPYTSWEVYVANHGFALAQCSVVASYQGGPGWTASTSSTYTIDVLGPLLS